jgi:predicted peptidase
MVPGINKISAFAFCLFWVAGCSLAASQKTSDANVTKPVPGAETRIESKDKNVGGGYFLVYVPADYNDSRDWPVIFFYQGAGLAPSTQLMRQVTDGKDFIIVAMEYTAHSEKFTTGRYINYLKSEQRSIGAVRKYLLQNFKIDRDHLFLTGISKGGWLVSALAERNPAPWAGIAIFCAGRNEDLPLEDPILFAGKRIYIGTGQTDKNLPAARKAATYYTSLRAHTTFEMYTGFGHEVDTKAPQLRKWLRHQSVSAGSSENKGKINP